MMVYKLESEWDLGLGGLIWMSLDIANRDIEYALEDSGVGYNLREATEAGLIRVEVWELITK